MVAYVDVGGVGEDGLATFVNAYEPVEEPEPDPQPDPGPDPEGPGAGDADQGETPNPDGPAGGKPGELEPDCPHDPGDSGDGERLPQSGDELGQAAAMVGYASLTILGAAVIGKRLRGGARPGRCLPRGHMLGRWGRPLR